jgi:hypothetical protein
MLKKFRRQDHFAMSTLVAVLVTFMAALAVWSWHYNQGLVLEENGVAGLSAVGKPE